MRIATTVIRRNLQGGEIPTHVYMETKERASVVAFAARCPSANEESEAQTLALADKYSGEHLARLDPRPCLSSCMGSTMRRADEGIRTLDLRHGKATL